MAYTSSLEICKQHLFSTKEELQQVCSELVASKVLRVRGAYMWMLDDPSRKDREVVEWLSETYNVSLPAAYDDLKVVKAILPSVSEASKEFARWRYNEMILETYQKAKEKGNVKAMESAASSYARYNRLDIPDESKSAYDEIVVQPFTATEDPRTLGIEPIPNLQDKINSLLKKYRAESIDIDDVNYEEVDLEEDELYGEEDPGTA